MNDEVLNGYVSPPIAGQPRLQAAASVPVPHSPKRTVTCKRCARPLFGERTNGECFHRRCLEKLQQERAGVAPPSYADLAAAEKIIRKTRVLGEGGGEVRLMPVGNYMEDATCVRCGNIFVARDPRAKYCGLACFGETRHHSRHNVSS